MVKKIGKYEFGKTLGTGTFGKVKYAVDTSDPNRKPFAIKALVRAQILKENMGEQLKNEIAIMKVLAHENVVRMYEVIQSQDHIYIVLELAAGGELFDRILAAKHFDEPTARRYFQQLTFAINYCHKQGVAHRDLKPENLLLDANDNLKISDFGLSSFSSAGGKERLLTTTCGTPNYVAPEVIKEKGYNGFISDIWSCGVIVFVMLAGYLPFEDPTTNGLFIKIERGEYHMPRQFSDAVKAFIPKLLTVEPTKRITMAEIFFEPWFCQNTDQKLLDHNRNVGKVELIPNNAAAPESIADISSEIVNTPLSPTNQTKRNELTAFELASQLVMGSLSPLLNSGSHVRLNTQFIANNSLNAAMTRINSELEKMKCKPSPSKTGQAIKGYVTGAKGLIIFTVSFNQTVCHELVLVECRRMRGDTFDFQKFYRELVKNLVDIVPQQPAVSDSEK